MSYEIERKFLVVGEYKHLSKSHKNMVQAYILSVPERTVRIRIAGEQAFITIKGKSELNGLSRFEWEKEIALADAEELLKLCEPGMVEKTRYYIPYKQYVIEVDEFKNANQGLLLAEVELSSVNDIFEKPDWLGKEVTNDRRYYNSYLAHYPFRKWDEGCGV